MSLFDSVASSVGGSIGGKIGAMVESAVGQVASKYIPSSVMKGINDAGRIGGDLMSGDILGAGRHLLNTGVLGDLGGFSGMAKQAAFWASETPMFANVSPSEAKAIYKKSQAVELAQKNWFVLEVSSPLGGDISERFNLLASDVEYSPQTLTAEKRKIGGVTVDSVQSSEPTDLSITTMDNADGDLKSWFNNHVWAAVSTDGTIGYPADYAIKIKIVHGYPFGKYQDIGLFRPTNMTVSLSRKEAGIQELTMTFSQLDTFIRP
ncbi:MAG: hypothetical protein WCL34_12745 [Methylococcaceae bacterium]